MVGAGRPGVPRLARPATRGHVPMGANTYRVMSGFAAGEIPAGADDSTADEEASVDGLTKASKVVFSASRGAAHVGQHHARARRRGRGRPSHEGERLGPFEHDRQHQSVSVAAAGRARRSLPSRRVPGDHRREREQNNLRRLPGRCSRHDQQPHVRRSNAAARVRPHDPGRTTFLTGPPWRWSEDRARQAVDRALGKLRCHPCVTWLRQMGERPGQRPDRSDVVVEGELPIRFSDLRRLRRNRSRPAVFRTSNASHRCPTFLVVLRT